MIIVHGDVIANAENPRESMEHKKTHRSKGEKEKKKKRRRGRQLERDERPVGRTRAQEAGKKKEEGKTLVAFRCILTLIDIISTLPP